LRRIQINEGGDGAYFWPYVASDYGAFRPLWLGLLLGRHNTLLRVRDGRVTQNRSGERQEISKAEK